jgi:ADP-ribosylglycohydrolase
MRAAPAAWAGGFQAGVVVAALTHGHPTGYLAAGAFAEILRRILEGESLQAAIDAALDALHAWKGGADQARETIAAITAARRAASGDAAPAAEAVERLGQGWVAEEALAIALYAALVAGDFRGGVLLAVNHSGDSDSTGAIAGNLLGALGGEAALPAEWVEPLEAGDVIRQVATDLCQPIPQFDDDPRAWEEHQRHYPYYT